MLELSIAIILSLTIIAFLCEYIDSTLGMGYGTTLTPLLLILGFNPLQIVPAVLASELITGLLAAFFHHHKGNVYLKPKTTRLSVIIRGMRKFGIIESFKRGFPMHLKVSLLLGMCGIGGAILAVLIAVNIPKAWLKIYIGVLVLSMGIVILTTLNKKFSFSWKKMITLGLLASFNKGISGGGYGPLVTGGQILAGVEGKSAVGITSLAEGLTCFVGIIAYLFISKSSIDWTLAPYLTAGAVLSVPFSVISVKRISAKKLKLAIAFLTIILGMATLANAMRFF